MATITKNGLKFRQGSVCEKVYTEAFLNGKEPEIVAEALKLPIQTIKHHIYNIKRIITKIEVQGSTTTTTSASGTPRPDSLDLTLQIYEKRNKLILFVKTNPKWEKFVSRKELKESYQLWGRNKTGQFYQGDLLGKNVDDVNRPIILNSKINFGVLRIKDISLGIEFELDRLLNFEQLSLAAQEFAKAFKDLYDKAINKNKLKIEAYVSEASK